MPIRVRVGPPAGCPASPEGACSRLDVTRTRERKRKMGNSARKKTTEHRVLLDIELPTCRQGEVGGNNHDAEQHKSHEEEEEERKF